MKFFKKHKLITLCLAFIIFLFIGHAVLGESAKQDSFETHSASIGFVYNGYWRAQTFTATSTYTPDQLCVWAYTDYGLENFVGSIREVVDSKPYGADLCTGFKPWSEFTFDTAGERYCFDITSCPELTAATSYALVFRSDSNSGGGFLRGASAGGYDGGQGATSSNSGSNWTLGPHDLYFEVWGEAQAPPPAEFDSNMVWAIILLAAFVLITFDLLRRHFAEHPKQNV